MRGVEKSAVGDGESISRPPFTTDSVFNAPRKMTSHVPGKACRGNDNARIRLITLILGFCTRGTDRGARRSGKEA